MHTLSGTTLRDADEEGLRGLLAGVLSCYLPDTTCHCPTGSSQALARQNLPEQGPKSGLSSTSSLQLAKAPNFL